MAETFLFNITESALSKLSFLAAEQIRMAWNIKSEVRRLHNTLSTIKAVILDAEEQQLKNHKVRDWLQKLKDAVCNIDDFLDDLTTRAPQRDMEIWNKVTGFFSGWNSVVFRFKVGHRIRGLRQKLDEIAADRSKFQFTEETRMVLMDSNVREQTHSYVRASDIIGRDSDKESIGQMLLSSNNNNDDDHVAVIPIVGIGGLGKTTVTKLAYNDVRVIQRFGLRMWVSSLSEHFTLGKTVEKILKSATGKSFGHLDMDQMQCRLAGVLNGTRYLLVLDDVWNVERIK
ncbi:putative disease resistance protein RGA3 [Salvia divinorum]|uniref:Disease resistance protein RGA3 n=1 Tax=Salvia divinorum TaxID=28513 RepID=A0ABD1HE69_SALDI